MKPSAPAEPPKSLAEFARDLGREPLDVWKESLSMLRQLHNDVWNGVRFFMTMNGILLAGLAGWSRTSSSTTNTAQLALIIAILGVVITLTARRILSGHRDYYLNMLVRKSLIEEELGFYARRLATVDMSFPWSIPQSDLVNVKADTEAWLRAQRTKKGTITRLLFRSYEGVVVIWICIAILSSYTLLQTLFGVTSSQSPVPAPPLVSVPASAVAASPSKTTTPAVVPPKNPASSP